MLWRERIELFWPIWIAITLVGLLVVIFVVPEKNGRTSGDSIPPRKQDWSVTAILAVMFLILFLACYIAGSLVWEDFTYYDNSHFTNGTLLGQNITVQILPWNGRFWPLGHQEFNLIRHFTHSVLGYHALRIVQLVLLCGILMVLDDELSIPARVSLILLILITPSLVTSFSGLVYAEWNIVFLLACLTWFLKRFGETRAIRWAAAAVISAQLILYYKETAFLLVLGFAVSRLLLRCWKADQGGWDFKRLRDPESRLDICLALLVVPFFLYYLAAMFPNFSMGYADEFRIRRIEVLASYVYLDLLIWVLAVTVVVRVVLILRQKATPSPLWDGLALAATGYFVGYLVLSMSSAYFLAPADLVAILYLGRLAILSIRNMGVAARLAALALVSFVVVQDLSLSAFRMYERKNVIHAKAGIGHAIKARYDNNPESVTLFFPHATPFHMMEFASYLNYIGVPIEGAGSAKTNDVRLVGAAITKDGPCGYRAFICHPRSRPDQGDLVVEFPDDFTSTDELKLYRQESQNLVFSYDPYPPVPQWLRPYVDRLHVISPEFSQSRLPDSWLNASVTVSK